MKDPLSAVEIQNPIRTKKVTGDDFLEQSFRMLPVLLRQPLWRVLSRSRRASTISHGTHLLRSGVVDGPSRHRVKAA